MEKQPKDTVGLQPTEPNTLYQKPTDHARRMPMEQNKREQFIICALYAMIWLQTTEPMV